MRSWADFLRNHPDNGDFDVAASAIADLNKSTNDKEVVFAKLTESTPLVVASKSAVSGTVQYLFKFFKLGNDLIKKAVKYGGMMGFGPTALTVSVDPMSLLEIAQEKKQAPPFKDLLMANSEEAFKAITRENSKGWKKRHVPDAVIMIPSLSAIILDNPEMEPAVFLTKATEIIRTKYVNEEIDKDQDTLDRETQEIEAATTGEKEDGEERTGLEDPFRDESGELEGKFYDVLLFYWYLIHDGEAIHPTPVMPDLSEAANEIADKNRKELGVDLPRQVGQADSSFASSQLTEAITAMSLSMEDATKAKQKEKQSKSKEKEQADWNKLPLLSQHVIRGLQARFADDLDDDELEDVVVPDGPNRLMSTVIRCSTGARVQQLLNHTLSVTHNCIVSLNMGMCTALKNGLLLSQPSPNEVSNFSPHFTPPLLDNAEDSSELQLRLEEQSKNGKLSADDLALVTNQKIQYPESYNALRHFVRNFTFLVVELAGSNSIVASELLEVVAHVEKFETDYSYHFHEFQGFGAFFINKIHVGIQKFLHSCACGQVSKLNLLAIEFKHFLKSIDGREITFVRLPSYLRKPKSKKRDREGDKDDRAEGGRGRDKRRDTKKKRVTYDERDPQAKLATNQRFGDVFCRDCRAGVEQPKMDDGTEMCNRLYGKGYCFEDCRRSHRKKNAAEQGRWKKFLKDILEKWKSKKENEDFDNNGERG